MANFNYCPLVWILSSASSLKKIVNLQKRAQGLLCNDWKFVQGIIQNLLALR